jgi:hypothetical protein
MPYTALNDAETATGAPVTQTLWRKVKDNLDYLLSGISTGGVSATVLNGSFEADSNNDGIPDTWTRSLYAGGASGVDTTTPMHGAKTIYLTHPGGAGNGGGYFESDYVIIHQLIPRRIGWLMYSTAAGMKNEVLVRAYDKDLTEIGSGTVIYTSTSNPTTPTYCIRSVTPPANARFLKVRMIGGKSDTDVSGSTYFDDVTITPITEGFGAFTIAETSTNSQTFVDAGSGSITLPNLGTVLLNITFNASLKVGTGNNVSQRFRIGTAYSATVNSSSATYSENSFSVTALVDASAAVTIYQQLYGDGNTVYGKKDASRSVAAFTF